MKYAALDTETTEAALTSNDFTLHCISVAWSEGVATYRTVEDFLAEWDVNEWSFVMHNSKFDLRVLRVKGLHLPNWEDSMLLGYCYKSAPTIPEGAKSGHSLEAWGLRLKFPKLEFKEFEEYSDEMRVYCEQDAKLTFAVWEYLNSVVDATTFQFYNNIDKPFVEVIMAMESNGYLIDSATLESAKQELNDSCEALLSKMQEQVGQPVPSTTVKYRKPREQDDLLYVKTGDDPTSGKTYHYYQKLKPFNPASSGQKAWVLTEVFGVELKHFTEKGAPQVGDAELKELADGGRTKLGKFIDTLREYNEKSKLVGTFVEGILDALHSDGRVRANYNQTVTRTGRLSSSNPNLQNLPSKGDGGGLIRKAVVAPEGKKLICADVSQFQYRIAVYLLMQKFGLSRDDVRGLVETYTEGKNGGDIHEGNRALLAQYAPEMFNAEGGRKHAKVFGFSLLFGAGAQKISETTDLTLDEAKTIVEAGRSAISSFDDLKKEYIGQARNNAGVTRDLYGRRLEYKGLMSSDRQEKAKNERQIFNAIVQSTEGSIMKVMMLTMLDELPSEVLILGVVHDEVILECPEHLLEDTLAQVEEIMSRDYLPANGDLPAIPVMGGGNSADNWYEAKD